MIGVISRCNICEQFLDAKKKLRKHKDKDHRISNSKMMVMAVALPPENTTTNQVPAATGVKGHYHEELCLTV